MFSVNSAVHVETPEKCKNAIFTRIWYSGVVKCVKSVATHFIKFCEYLLFTLCLCIKYKTGNAVLFSLF